MLTPLDGPDIEGVHVNVGSALDDPLCQLFSAASSKWDSNSVKTTAVEEPFQSGVLTCLKRVPSLQV
jgi:hypothetical protein